MEDYNENGRIEVTDFIDKKLNDEGRERVHELLRNISSDYDPDIADLIMDRNFVCHDFFTWNFEEWREMTDEEIMNSKKKIKRGK